MSYSKNKSWMRPSKLAKQLKVSPQVINNWKARGKLDVKRDKENDLTLVRIKKAG